MKRSIIIVAAVLFLGGIYLIYFATTPKANIVQFPKELLDSTNKGMPNLKLPIFEYESRIEERVKESPRDPFASSTQKSFSGDLNLQAVSIDAKGEGIAMINGDTYRKNESVGAYTLKELNKDYVILDKNGNAIMLKIEREELK